jgi:hypothetical protein
VSRAERAELRQSIREAERAGKHPPAGPVAELVGADRLPNRAARRYVVNVRGWPGVDLWRPPTAPPAYAPRLADKVSLVIAGAAEKGVMPETFGLGSFQITQGHSVFDAGIIVQDNLGSKQRKEIVDWARANTVETTSGLKAQKVLTVSEFFEPHHGVFARVAYTGAGFVVGADLLRFFGLTAEYVVNCTGKYADGWELYPPGWGKVGTRQNVKRAGPHRPCIRASSNHGPGSRMGFGPLERGNGKYVGGRQWKGAFMDVRAPACALSGSDVESLPEYGADLGLELADVPVAAPVDGDGAAIVARAGADVHALALALDAEAAEYFTTSQDRSEGRGRLSLPDTYSTGGLGSQVVTRAGMRAPLGSFKLDDAEAEQWANSFHGPLIHADPLLYGVPFPAVTADISSCYPLAAHLIGWWDLICAIRISRRDVTDELRTACDRAAADPRAALDPKLFARFGCCMVELRPDGDVLPVELHDPRRPEGRLEFPKVYAKSPDDPPMFYSALDVLASAVATGRPPTIIRATAYVPVGRQSGIRRHLPILPGLAVDTEDDPVLALVARRRQAKAEGDFVLAAMLRVLVNALVYGNLCRFDEIRLRGAHGWGRGERPGPLNCMPIASSITAGSHLLLTVGNRMVRDLGGVVAYAHSDSLIIPSSPTGGELALADGSPVRELSWAEVDAILGAFDPLSPAPDWPVWGQKRGTEETPLKSLIFGPTRHVETIGGEIVELTESGMGGTYADPHSLRGREVNGFRSWSLAAIQREVTYTAAKTVDPETARRPDAIWDIGAELSFPALRRLEVKTPEQAKQLPAALGARPGTRYLQASGAGAYSTQTVVALDLGGHLSEWPSLVWLSTRTGQPERVSTDLNDHMALTIETLADKGVDWGRPGPDDQIDAVVIDPDLVTHKGRAAGAIQAVADGLADPHSCRPDYGGADPARFVVTEANRLGPTEFAKRYGISLWTAKGVIGGRIPRPATVARVMAQLGGNDDRTCALPECSEPVSRSGQLYCKEAHKKKAHRLRAKTTGKAKPARRRPHSPNGLAGNGSVIGAMDDCKETEVA